MRRRPAAGVSFVPERGGVGQPDLGVGDIAGSHAPDRWAMRGPIWLIGLTLHVASMGLPIASLALPGYSLANKGVSPRLLFGLDPGRRGNHIHVLAI